MAVMVVVMVLVVARGTTRTALERLVGHARRVVVTVVVVAVVARVAERKVLVEVAAKAVV